MAKTVTAASDASQIRRNGRAQRHMARAEHRSVQALKVLAHGAKKASRVGKKKSLVTATTKKGLYRSQLSRCVRVSLGGGGCKRVLTGLTGNRVVGRKVAKMLGIFASRASEICDEGITHINTYMDGMPSANGCTGWKEYVGDSCGNLFVSLIDDWMTEPGMTDETIKVRSMVQMLNAIYYRACEARNIKFDFSELSESTHADFFKLTAHGVTLTQRCVRCVQTLRVHGD